MLRYAQLFAIFLTCAVALPPTPATPTSATTLTPSPSHTSCEHNDNPTCKAHRNHEKVGVPITKAECYWHSLFQFHTADMRTSVINPLCKAIQQDGAVQPGPAKGEDAQPIVDDCCAEAMQRKAA